jgi:hypothetical protein
MSDEIRSYGWTAVPRDRSNVPSAEEAAAPQTDAAAVDITGIWPDNELTKKARDYAKRELPTETYNHSLRVYAYGKQALHLISSGFRKKEQHLSRRVPTTANPHLIRPLFKLKLTTPQTRSPDCHAVLARLEVEHVFRNVGADMPVPRYRDYSAEHVVYAHVV